MTRPAPASLYEDDFFAWTQEQAAALRRIPASAARSHVDIEHVAEEIEDLGRRDLREVASFLRRLFEHLIKIGSDPGSRGVVHWRDEGLEFHQSARDAFAPSMRHLLDVSKIWRMGRAMARKRLEPRGTRVTAPLDCPFTLDEVLAEDFDVDAARAKIAAHP